MEDEEYKLVIKSLKVKNFLVIVLVLYKCDYVKVIYFLLFNWIIKLKKDFLKENCKLIKLLLDCVL